MTQEKNSTSIHGLCLIRRFENLSLKAYLDSNGHITIGWGHLLPHGSALDIEWTGQQSEDAFENDVKWAEDYINALHIELTQPQFDALTSLVFNIGTGHFAVSTVKEKILCGSMDAAADAFLLWNDHGNAKERRALERAIFIYGTVKECKNDLEA